MNAFNDVPMAQQADGSFGLQPQNESSKMVEMMKKSQSQINAANSGL